MISQEAIDDGNLEEMRMNAIEKKQTNRLYKEEVSTLLGTINTLINELENNVTMPSSAELGMKYAIGMILDNVYTFLWQDWYNGDAQNEVDDAWIEDMMEHSEQPRHLVEEMEVDNDFICEYFNEEFGIDVNDNHLKLLDKYREINKALSDNENK